MSESLDVGGPRGRVLGNVVAGDVDQELGFENLRAISAILDLGEMPRSDSLRNRSAPWRTPASRISPRVIFCGRLPIIADHQAPGSLPDARGS